MNDKAMYTVGVLVFSTIFAYIPSIFGAGIFSFWSLIFSALGGFLTKKSAYAVFGSSTFVEKTDLSSLYTIPY